MLILKVMSVLLSYPQAETLAALDEMASVVQQEHRLSAANKAALLGLIDGYRNADLLDCQERYVALFDRGRFLSLHIFEHVHGESRDRGQAMVNLLQLYQSHGFEMDVHELPDYIPLFLEFLAQLDAEKQVMQLLQDAMPVLSLLGVRLTERDSEFQAIFAALTDIAGAAVDLADIQQQVALEGEDETLANMDAIWEEEAVSFMAAGDTCHTQTGTVNPITITPRDQILNSSPSRSL